MKTFLIIVLTGALGFVAVGVVQEWHVFAADLGITDPAPPSNKQQHGPAGAAVRRYLLMSKHLYRTGFDPRFADRLGASAALVEELRAEVDFLKHRRWVQQARLVKLMLEATRTVGPDQVEVRTREYWIISVRRQRDKRATTRSTVARCRYRVVRVGSGWVVDSWEFVPADQRAAGQ